MPITTAPALLVGLGARLLLDHWSREGSPGTKDFVLLGTWQGVALHYATKNSGTSGFGVLVAFAIGIKLFIEFNLDSDLNKCIITVFGVALGVVFTDVLSGYIDSGFSRHRRKSSSSSATKKPRQPTTEKPEKKRERTVQFRPNVSDITSVDDGLSDKMGPMSSLPPHEREIHVLRMRAALADSERRRCKEERKWAVSQGNLARASQMKWEVKRYTALMETFNKEAEEKTAEYMKSAASSQPTAESSKAAKEREARTSTRTSTRTASTSTTHPNTKPSSSRRLSITKTNGKPPHG